MNLNFELILLLATAIAGLIWLLYSLYAMMKQRSLTTPYIPSRAVSKAVEYARSFFPILLLVLLLRSFLVEPFRIPSGSLKPTLLPGDFILANKFAYGLRLPVWHTKIWQGHEPQEGDIVVIRWPVDPSIYFIKRVIGVPGDHISYQDKTLYINGVQVPQVFQHASDDVDDEGNTWQVVQSQEIINGIHHSIFLRPDLPAQDFDVTVPKDQYFMMGDNRDSSNDSRYWGFVPEANLIGKAFVVWMSWDNHAHRIRMQRLGMAINS
jgi:signal peptidase I